MTLQEALKESAQKLKAGGIESYQLDADLIFAFSLNLERVDLYAQSQRELTEIELGNARSLIFRRSVGEPVAYILGYKDFYKHRFYVQPGVLVPRPETELLVEVTLAWYKANAKAESLSIMDLGCGSGCIGLTLLTEIPDSRLRAIDQSAVAIAVTKENAEQLGVGVRVQIVKSVVEEFESRQQADIIVANPPYISASDHNVDWKVKKFEPHEALFAKERGLEYIRSWGLKTSEWLKPGGFFAFEMGATQGNQAKELFEKFGCFTDVTISKDLAGLDRVVSGRKR